MKRQFESILHAVILVFLFAFLPVIAYADPSAALQRIIQEANIPAAAWVIVLPGEDPMIGVSGKNVTQDTPFRLGSITKTFTVLTLLKIAETRGLAVSTPVDRILPPGRFTNGFASPVTLRDLLALTSGHTDVGFEAFADNTARPLQEALRRNSAALTSLWPPGLLHSYTNATPGLSEHAIELLTGVAYPEAVRRLLAEPLDFAFGSFDNMAALPGGFRSDGNTPIPYWNMTFKAFGGLSASAGDMTHFLETLVDGGIRDGNPVWSKAIQQQLLTPAPTFASKAGLRLGYGTGMYSRLRRGMLWHGHGGDADGYRSRYGFLPDQGAAYFVVINTDNPDVLIRLETILEGSIADALATPHVERVITGPDLPDAGGTYYPATVRFGVDDWHHCRATSAQLRVDGPVLFVRIGEHRHQLRSVGNHRLARKDNNEPVMALVEDAAGVTWFVGELGNYVRINTRITGQPVPVPAFMPRCLAE